MHVKVKFVEGFKDGSIFPRSFAPGDEYVVTQAQLEQIQRSGGNVQVVEQQIANPLKAQKAFDAQFKEPNDPYNAENEINDLENHVPGTEDVIEEARALREAMRERREREARGAEDGSRPPLGLNDPEGREAEELRKEAEAEKEPKVSDEELQAEKEAETASFQDPKALKGTPGREALSDMLTEEQKDSIIPGEDAVVPPVDKPRSKKRK